MYTCETLRAMMVHDADVRRALTDRVVCLTHAISRVRCGHV